MITAATINDITLDPGRVLADISVLHGRKAVTDGPVPSSATITVEQPPGAMPPWTTGDTLTLTFDGGLPAFSGRIADIPTVTHHTRADGTTVARLVVTASGTVARLGYRNVGDEPWPAEGGTARAERVLTLAEVPYLIDGAADQILLPRDVDSRPALQLLGDIIVSTAAAVVDLPDGRVVYQPMAERARPVRPFRWMDFDPAMTWADFPPDMTWADFDTWTSADSEFPVAIPPGAVDWEPPWMAASARIINHARVGYGTAAGGAEQPWVEAIDQASIDRYGRRYQYIGTELQDVADAQAAAARLVTVNATPHWGLGDITIHPDRLDGPTRAAVMALTCGDHITLAGMPQPAPAAVYEGIVEGWTYTMWGVSGRLYERLTLHTSAPLESLAVMTWADFPPELTWADFPAYLTWADLTSVDVLGAA